MVDCLGLDAGPSSSLNDGELLDQLDDYQLLNTAVAKLVEALRRNRGYTAGGVLGNFQVT